MEPTEFDPTSHTETDDLRAKFKELVPTAFTEQAIDFDRLKTLLGEMVDSGQERYSFTWPGKAQAIRAAQTPSIGTLVPDKDASVDWDTTQNLYLEGDNLEILKLLQKSYTGKVKVIYIDPPYNTGRDFVYPDNYGEGLKTYLEYTGQVDGEGKKITTNTETDGRYHSKWLNMMYPRLMLARNLLKDDGVIFISIDDHEQANLKKICDEIFGAENFIDSIIWKKTENIKMDSHFLSQNKDFILCYRKSPELLEFQKEQSDVNRFNLIDEKGSYYLRKLDSKSSAYRKTLDYVIEHEGNSYYAGGSKDAWEERQLNKVSGYAPRWLWSKEKFEKGLADGEIIFRDGKVYNKVRYDGIAKKPFINIQTLVSGQTAQKDLDDLFGKRLFDHPKPPQLIDWLVRLASDDKTAIVLDFFSGSGTTAHAVMELNAGDGGNRKFIITQLQEPTPEDSEARKAGYQNIAALGRERIKRAGAKTKQDYADKIVGRETPLDTGFRTYRLTASNFNTWDATSGDDLQGKLLNATSLIKADAQDEDVLAELILKSGFGLSESVSASDIHGVQAYTVADNDLVIVLRGNLTEPAVRAVAELAPKRFIAREDAFADDAALTNAAQIMKDKGIDFRVL